LAFPRLPLPAGALVHAVSRSGLLLLATLAPAGLLLYLSPLSRMPAPLQLASCLLLAALCWLGAVRAGRHSLRPEVALVMSHCVRMARQLAGQPAASGGAPEILR
jgi:hypothetical protein